MEYITEEQILHYKELCAEPVREITEELRLTRLFRENIRLANHIVSKISSPRDPAIDREDMLQEAYLALWRVCCNFDESKGFAFSTYALPYIRGAVLRMLRDNEPIKTSRAHKDIRSLLEKYGYTLPLTEEEIVTIMTDSTLTRRQIEAFTELSVMSFDAPISGTEDFYLGDVVRSPEEIEYQFSDEEIESLVDKILQYIKPLHKDIVEEWMYATLAGSRITNQQLADKYNMRQPSVSRILNAAIAVVRMHRDEILELFGL